ncbi:hypothetical protein GALMADRAFT_1364406 [Galerina marginata CBS 339.88]|uniref:Uncharacterized protein n=1 Tax=Galerina marginata (strain CBS 339.88) TaxID=685588 RepID=A0A067TBH7_GALM3|nr:hypothetical protein GALMADRAFT_1364406 [Galerina marginata CBS 339.88]
MGNVMGKKWKDLSLYDDRWSVTAWIEISGLDPGPGSASGSSISSSSRLKLPHRLYHPATWQLGISTAAYIDNNDRNTYTKTHRRFSFNTYMKTYRRFLFAPARALVLLLVRKLARSIHPLLVSSLAITGSFNSGRRRLEEVLILCESSSNCTAAPVRPSSGAKSVVLLLMQEAIGMQDE